MPDVKKSVDDFVIVVDTREQNPLFKGKKKGITRSKLEAGDYSVKGFEDEITVERKSVMDFLNSITRDRERFKKELARMREYSKKFIVVEGDIEELLGPQVIKSGITRSDGETVRPIVKQYTQVNPKAVFNTIVSIMLRYDVIFFFAKGRREAERFVVEVLSKFHKLKRKREI